MAILQPVPQPEPVDASRDLAIDLRQPDYDDDQLEFFPHLVITLAGAADPEPLPSEMSGMYYLG